MVNFTVKITFLGTHSSHPQENKKYVTAVIANLTIFQRKQFLLDKICIFPRHQFHSPIYY